eukprot:CAMPEP_0117655458 /NCGR_PEP_ID=MMETSP0804-20121206/4289_1 /TAXON_ID=1074897 /ORGANISM="Tetraselmis astigmatica, Strain CCMP880" /LENGTH=320 /DNA_ID=CAMNT_0005461809 /DNA_START=75 /DNA_END=1037 /DNA_ORIENTATION=-
MAVLQAGRCGARLPSSSCLRFASSAASLPAALRPTGHLATTEAPAHRRPAWQTLGSSESRLLCVQNGSLSTPGRTLASDLAVESPASTNPPEAIASAGTKAMERMLSAAPASLYFERHVGRPKESWENSTVGRSLLWLGGYYTKESQANRGGKLLLDVIMEQATNPAVFQGFMLEAEQFPCKQGLISLHVWLCLTRLRLEGKQGQQVSQTLYDLFQEDVEARVRAAGVKVRISKWLTELEQRFLGAATAYDKALKVPDMAESKALLTEALWRNVYNGEGEMSQAHILQRYVRRELACLAITDSQAVLDGQIRFSRPEEVP